MKPTVDDIVVVVRSSGERSLPLLLRSLENQISTTNINVVNLSPFFKSVLETFQIGASQPDKQFLLALNADVVLADNAIQTFLDEAALIDQGSVFRVRFDVKDKFVGARDAGNHLYVNQWSVPCLRYLLKKGRPNTWRPESGNVGRFGKWAGLSTNEKISLTVGTHGYHQYFRDTYSKMSNFYIKYNGDKEKLLNQLCLNSEKFVDDFDFKVAYEGALHGMRNRKMRLNSKLFPCIDAWLL